MTEEVTESPLPARGKRDPAPHGQLVTFILTDYPFFYHRTADGAKREREFLQAKTGKEYKLFKVLMISSETLETHDVKIVKKAAPND